MPNQIASDRRRASYVPNIAEHAELTAYAKRSGFTLSVLQREATHRLANILRSDGEIQIIQNPRAGDSGEPNIPKRKSKVFIVSAEDYDILKAYAKSMCYNVSILVREAIFRLARDLRLSGELILILKPVGAEGKSTMPDGPRRRKV